MKKILLCLICWVSTSLWADDTIVGFWKSVSDKTGKAESIVAIYEYQGKYYGRLIRSLDATEKTMVDTIDQAKKRALTFPKNPYYSGMDFIWALKREESIYKGEILDPDRGVYL